MAARLTDKQKKKMIADRVNGMSFRKLAEKYGVSTRTVQRVVKSDPEVTQKATLKKEQNTLDMLAYMDSRKEVAQGLIDYYLIQLADPAKMAEASLVQVATALGIIVDKFTRNTPSGENALEKLDQLLEGLDHAAQQ